MATVSNKLSDVPKPTHSDRIASDANLLYVSKSVGNVKQATLVDMVYPVGSIYISVNTTNPGTLFGGTWEQIKDRFILAAGGSYTVGSTGGEATHTLTVNEMPRHSHDRIACQNYYLGDKGLPFNGTEQSAALITTSGASNQSAGYYGTIPSGGSAAHNNMPPYLAVYMWKRTA